MKLPDTAVIPDEKLTSYLLVPRRRNDKSNYLAQAGFTQHNPEALRDALRVFVQTHDALPNRFSDYGTMYTVEGLLLGVNGIGMPIVTVWIECVVDGVVQFVTLKPVRRSSDVD
jgi:hypothetical protein